MILSLINITILASAQGATITVDAPEQLRFGGYGEVTYRSLESSNDVWDAHRVIIYMGYDFDETWSFDAEFEFEHGTETYIEFAQLDGKFSDEWNFRAGHLLLPMGLINERHEPTYFWGPVRPLVETKIIPTTWHENGVGFYGTSGDMSYQFYVMNGFSNDIDFSSSAFRSGRQKGDRADAENLAYVGSLEYQVSPGLMIGGSMYSQTVESAAAEHGVDILEAHLQYDSGAFRTRALMVKGTVENAENLDAHQAIDNDTGSSVWSGLAGADDDVEGMYVEVGYDLMSHSDTESLTPFFRHETYEHNGTDIGVNVLGVSYMPNPNIAYKVGLQSINESDSDVNEDNVEFTIGWRF
jgi:hypothetical protein